MKDSHLQPLWTRGFGNECGRLFQGIRDIPGTDTCFFTTLKNIPTDRKITYGNIVCDYNFQNPNQQHPLHRRRRHDDDGHQYLLYRHPAAAV
jgi:hypothetical protein